MDTIAILDFGGQYAHLIANRIRRLQVYSEIISPDTPLEVLKKYKGIIFSGGPKSVYEPNAIHCDPGILELGVPLLGICYGHQLLAYLQGAKVEADSASSEFGLTTMEVKKPVGLFEGLAPQEVVWMSHGDSVKELPPGYEVIGSTKNGHWAALANLEKNFFGVQFHLEVTHTKSGQKMLENFLNLCGVKREWKLENFIEEEIAAIKAKVGNRKVFMLVSGGVDSTVAYALLYKALGPENIYGLLIDTGFLRENEAAQVMESLTAAGFQNLHVRNASLRYFEALQDIYDPEAKRKIIGDLFLRIQEEVVKELDLNPEDWLLGQGTIYPDTIESGGTQHADKIKTHHNRVAEIEEMLEQGKIIEPLAQLYKDEVREIGLQLGLSDELIWRHPFPGPGLAVRCLCAQQENYPKNAVTLERTLNDTLASSSLQGKILPIQSVGVQGDYRTYRHPFVLMGKKDFVTLDSIATDLINNHHDINRMLWLLAPNRIQSIKIQKQCLTPKRIKLLQKADTIVHNFIKKHGLMSEIWQFPVILIPCSINRDLGEAIVLRPVQSAEAMTANFYHMDQGLLEKLAASLMELEGITAVMYDITNKPPGTIEWE